jgi:carboxymethylenebutenolidase
MGEDVTFPSNGSDGQGYLAVPAGGSGPGVVVLQEWWGLVPHIKDVADRFAAEGFVALAPDIYRGDSVANTEPDEAGKLMMSLNIERAAKDMVGAVDYLKSRPEVTGGIGVVGFCMGGGLTLWLATLRPDDINAAAPYYGVLPWPAAQPDYSALAGKVSVQGHYATEDDFATPEAVGELEAELNGHGVDNEFFIYDNAGHAFFNDTRPEAYHAGHAATAWRRTVDFFKKHL